MKAASIVDDTVRMPIEQLHPHPDNPRRGNVQLIAESLALLGQYRTIVVNRGSHTGRPFEILAGHHLVLAAQSLGWEDVSVGFVDVDDQTALRIMAVDNRSGDVASYDDRLLAELLSSLPDLEATGYSDADLAAIVAGLDGDMPEPGDADVTESATVFGVIVTCDDEAQQVALLQRFSAEGLNVRAIL